MAILSAASVTRIWDGRPGLLWRRKRGHCACVCGPAKREFQIAEHACRKYSGRVGRSAAARSFDEAAVRLAVAAHIRHRETNYDELLAAEWDRTEARSEIKYKVHELLRPLASDMIRSLRPEF
jgi:hypothetical protein